MSVVFCCFPFNWQSKKSEKNLLECPNGRQQMSGGYLFFFIFLLTLLEKTERLMILFFCFFFISFSLSGIRTHKFYSSHYLLRWSALMLSLPLLLFSSRLLPLPTVIYLFFIHYQSIQSLSFICWYSLTPHLLKTHALTRAIPKQTILDEISH